MKYNPSSLSATLAGQIYCSGWNNDASNSGNIYPTENSYVSRIVVSGGAHASNSGTYIRATVYVYFKDGTSTLLFNQTKTCNFKPTNPTFYPADMWGTEKTLQIDHIYAYVSSGNHLGGADNDPYHSSCVSLYCTGLPWTTD